MSRVEDLTLVTEPSADCLTDQQLVDYRAQRERCLDWLLTFGKDPDRADGYAFHTVKNRAARMDIFYRWVWDNETDGYTADVRHEHADAWLRSLAREDTSSAHKNNCRKAAMMLFKWRHHQHGLDEWDPAITFKSGGSASNPRDYLTLDERSKIREAALEYGTIPSYETLSAGERDTWKAHLAQRFEKPKSEVTEADWDRANSWEIPSLVWTSLDAGLRPIEVNRAVTGWVDLDNGVLRIPKEQSSKNRDNWIVSLQDRTVDALDRWLAERDTRTRYEGTDQLWVTREQNPFGSSSLRYVLRRLCDIAGIDHEDRQMSWYAIRHSTGTYMTREEDLAATQSQLRHKSAETTMKYDQAPVEDRRDALNRMN